MKNRNQVNISPSLHSASPLDLHVKGPLVSQLLNMAQFHVPSKVNMEELQKEKVRSIQNDVIIVD
jgi:tubulin polyglutamylase TTLL4